MSDKPSPGSKEAITQGCTCPTMDNANGRGIIINGVECFWNNGDCPIHLIHGVEK